MKLAYLIRSENHTLEFRSGIINRGKQIYAEKFNEHLAFVTSKLYDERLNEVGIVICVTNWGRSGLDERIGIAKEILRLARENNVYHIALGEIADIDFGEEIVVFDGVAYNFVYLVQKALFRNELNVNSEIGIVISKESNINVLRYLSEEFNYISIYCSDIAFASNISDILYEHNATCVNIHRTLSRLSGIESLFVLSPKMDYSLDYFKNALVINAFETDSELNKEMYCDRLKNLCVNASYAEYEYYLHNNIECCSSINMLREALKSDIVCKINKNDINI